MPLFLSAMTFEPVEKFYMPLNRMGRQSWKVNMKESERPLKAVGNLAKNVTGICPKLQTYKAECK
jgi:hypothetical protein